MEKQYELAFAASPKIPKIWFDFDRDTLFVTDEAFTLLSSTDLERVTRLKHFRYTGAMAQKCTS